MDAIRARQSLEPDLVGQVTLELIASPGKMPTLVCSDNGIGLTEEEVHRFLATIGESSKRIQSGERPTDFIGQFGIGLLACFLVSDEIVVVTRSVHGNSAVEWRGQPDGTYRLKTIQHDLAPGTQVFLTCKPEHRETFTPERVAELARHYGGLLPISIRMIHDRGSETLNQEIPPWRQTYPDEATRTRELLAYGQELFGMRFLDAVPLKSAAGQVDGLAFILAHSSTAVVRRSDRVYLKQMLLSESADNLLPDWAFFVKAVVNANDLRPTASRESFHEDERMDAARSALGDCLRNYLVEMAREHPDRFRQVLALHSRSIAALAVEDDDCFRLFIEWLTFETAEGWMTLPEYRRRHESIRFVSDLDQFRQIARVAAAQGIGVVNAGYVYGTELILRYAEMNPDHDVRALEASELAQSLEDLDSDEEDAAHDFLQAAEAVLRPHRCWAELRKFRPAELTSLYSTNSEGRFLRSLEQSQELANPLWSGVLQNVARDQRTNLPTAQLCFNHNNRLVRRLIDLGDAPTVRRAIQMLYVQAILLSHHPLTSEEWQLLNEGLLEMVEVSLERSEGGRP